MGRGVSLDRMGWGPDLDDDEVVAVGAGLETADQSDEVIRVRSPVGL